MCLTASYVIRKTTKTIVFVQDIEEETAHPVAGIYREVGDGGGWAGLGAGGWELGGLEEMEGKGGRLNIPF